jgi:hypothetical protein
VSRYSLILIYALVFTSVSAQKPLVNINSHQTVIQAVISSQKPLSTWGNIIELHANNPQVIEQIADAVLNHLYNMPAQAVFVPLLKHWQNHQPVITRPSDDHGHEVGVYLIAARASGELNRLLSQQTERYVYAVATNQQDKLLTELTGLYQLSHPAVTTGIKSALRHLTPHQQQAIIEQHLIADEITPFSPLLAVELNSPAIQEMIILSHQPTTIQALVNVWQHKPPSNTSILQTLLQQPGPHQVQALGLYNRMELTNDDTAWLISLLNHDTLGRTAARILGQQNNDKLMDNLFAHWQQDRTEPLNTNLLYALSRNPIGLKMLKSVVQQKSHNLSKNQQQWLQNQLGANNAK